jgi:transposase
MKQNVYTVGIDLAKKIFHLVGTDTTGTIVWRKRLTRHALAPFMAQLPPVTIGMEACGGAPYGARQFHQQGHHVKRMAPQFVKPYVKSNKNDRRDAEAIAEAVTRPTMRFVPIKDVDQQDIQALHRVRERLIGERTALINEVHGLMHAYGIVIPTGVAKFRQAVAEKLESEQDKLTPLGQEMLWRLVKECAILEEHIAAYQLKLTDSSWCLPNKVEFIPHQRKGKFDVVWTGFPQP